ncbi:MAG TPA: MarR family transcriptional regulator [Alphaproteobacteria bacterium]|jgi:DNA-binding MarR family transcriptional regulator
MVRQPRRIGALDLLDRVSRLIHSLQQAEGLRPAQWEALRYLSQANRYSRSPSAVTAFLHATRSPVSQVINSLVARGLVDRHPNPRDKRGVCLSVTEKGRDVLQRDPLNRVSAAVYALEDSAREAIEFGLGSLLSEMQRGRRYHAFGVCGTCRYFQPDSAHGEPGGPHRCGLTLEPLSYEDSLQICVEQRSA